MMEGFGIIACDLTLGLDRPSDIDLTAIRRVIQRLRTFGMVESARELESAIGEGEK